MYEHQTSDKILERLLSNPINNGLDTREGSIIYNALAPAAEELAKLYVSLDIFFQETFADTASLHYLIRRSAERGVQYRLATSAIVQGEFSPAGVDVIGARLMCDDMIFAVTEQIGLGIYRMECEKKGEAGNLSSGQLIPVNHIAGLETAQITGLLIPGEDDETTESLRRRFMASLNPVAYGGNVADYKAKTISITGVGGVKVYPVWNGGGTVKLTIINSTYGVPSSELIEEVQTTIDPVQNAGEGLGVAPVGHVVTVTGVSAAPIDISTNITYSGTWTWADLQIYAETVIDDYFLELSKDWEDTAALTIRISQIESRLLELDGVLDIEDTKINGVSGNYTLSIDEIPVRRNMDG